MKGAGPRNNTHNYELKPYKSLINIYHLYSFYNHFVQTIQRCRIIPKNGAFKENHVTVDATKIFSNVYYYTFN